jgi:hypothetical protein
MSFNKHTRRHTSRLLYLVTVSVLFLDQLSLEALASR